MADKETGERAADARPFLELRTDRTNFLLLPDEEATPIVADAAAIGADAPSITCVMASRGRLFPALYAIECFLRQTYPRRELLIATAAKDGLLARHVATITGHRVRLIEVTGPESASRLRNAAIAASHGELIAVWDDDDLSHPDRLAAQYRMMTSGGVAGCFLARVLLWWPARRRLAVSSARIWENTMLIRRSVMPPYPDQPRGEDTAIVEALRAKQPLLLLDTPEAYCYTVHGANMCGEDHFARLFAHGTVHFLGLDYDAAMEELAADLPIAGYEAGRLA
jgi:hypothetical protein